MKVDPEALTAPAPDLQDAARPWTSRTFAPGKTGSCSTYGWVDKRRGRRPHPHRRSHATPGGAGLCARAAPAPRRRPRPETRPSEARWLWPGPRPLLRRCASPRIRPQQQRAADDPARDRLRPEARRPLPLDAPFVDETGKRGAARRLLRPAARGADPRLLRLPDALHVSLNGLASALDDAVLRAGQGVRAGHRSASTPRRGRPRRRPRRSSSARALQAPGGGRGLALPDRRARNRSTGSRRRWASATPGTRRRSSSPIPRGRWSLTPDGRVSRYLFGIEYAPKDLRLALVEAGGRQDRRARRRRSSSSATSTPHTPAATAPPSCGVDPARGRPDRPGPGRLHLRHAAPREGAAARAPDHRPT